MSYLHKILDMVLLPEIWALRTVLEAIAIQISLWCTYALRKQLRI
jgi:hypothetical protein